LIILERARVKCWAKA